MNRRTALSAAGACVAVSLAGCLGGEEPFGEPLTDGGKETDDGDSAENEPQTDGGKETGRDDNGNDGDDDGNGRLTATLHTSEGDVEIELYGERAPRTVDNFVGLSTGEKEWQDPETGETVEGEPLYDDVLFHRVIEDFMIQTGDPTGTGRGGPGYTFDDEFHDELRHDGPGVVSMANSGPDTNGSQFFITLEATPHLDGDHSVFGQVIEGMDVVREIGGVRTDANDRPLDDVVLESVTVHDA